ncbi:MAG TPA: ABC transporter ATP-binding protein [Methylomirabilota bacterium]
MHSASDQDDVLGRAFDRRLAGRLWAAARRHHGLLAIALALFPLIAAAELAQPYLLKVAIDDHILTADWWGLALTAGLYALTLAALYALRMVEAYLMAVAGQRVTHDLRAALFDHLLRLEAAFFDRNPVGRLMTRVLNDVEAVSEAFTSGLLAIVADVVTLAGVVAIMLWMDWRLALVTFAIVPVLAAAAAYFRLRARDAYREVRRRLAVLNGFLQESLQGMTVTQLFARERQELGAFRRLNRDYRRALFGSTVFEASLYAMVEALGSVALALLIWYGSEQILGGALSFGVLVAFIQYTNRFFLPIRDLGAKFTVMQSAMASAERIFGLLDRAPTIVSPTSFTNPQNGGTGDPSGKDQDHSRETHDDSRESWDHGRGSRDHGRGSGATTISNSPPTNLPEHTAPATTMPTSRAALEFQHVHFSYHAGAPVLSDVSFRVAHGEHVAIVGATGEGKSTCARLLTRAYDVTGGRVLVNGVDVREWDLAQLRRHVGTVFQDTVLFTGSVADNLRVDGVGDLAAVRGALEAAHAATFVAALPGGLDEPLGERGMKISHGQRQLLAIARALVYNPPVLVLDEATSSVDPESEWMIREGMKRLLAGRTSVTIAHRLSTIQHADRIIVLHRGRVHEEGAHAELVRRHGLYARLWELAQGVATR